MNITFDTYTDVDKIPEEVWKSFSQTQTFSFDINYLKSVQYSKINNADLFYLIGYSGETPVGIAHLFIIDVDFSSFIDFVKKDFLETIKEWQPGFMVKRIAECGFLGTTGKGFSIAEGFEEFFIDNLKEEIENIAAEKKAQMILFRDISIEDYAYTRQLEKLDYMPLLGYPKASMEISWDSFDEYLSSLTSKRRADIKRSIRKSDKPVITYEWVNEINGISDRIFRLWNNVEQKSGYQHEKLNEDYFKNLLKLAPDNCRILLMKENSEIIAFSFFIETDRECFCSYVGLDYERNNSYDIYFNLVYKAVETAIEGKKKTLNLGISSYERKLLAGCEIDYFAYFIKNIENTDNTNGVKSLFEEIFVQPDFDYKSFKNKDYSSRKTPDEIRNQLFEIIDNNDIFRKIIEYKRSDLHKMSGLYAFFPPFESAQDAVVLYKKKEIIMMGSNSYMGLATRNEIKQAAIDAITLYGTGCSGSPILNGTLDIHEKLNHSLSAFAGKEDSIIFSTGYQTNLGVVSTLAGPGDVIIMDERCHASLIDGALLSRALIVRFRHNDLSSLEKKLESYRNKSKIIIVDSLYSMEGTIADLPGIVKLSKKYNSRLMVDESHAIGILGKNGAGVAEMYGLTDQIDIIMGTFSKSFAAQGGFICGDKLIITALKHLSRSHIFSASLTPAMVSVVEKAIQLIREEPDKRKKLLSNAHYLAEGLISLGYEVEDTGGAIVPLYCRDELLTSAFFHKLFEEGVFVNPVLFPAVPKGSELLRISLMATTTKEMIDKALEVFKKVRTGSFPLKK